MRRMASMVLKFGQHFGLPFRGPHGPLWTLADNDTFVMLIPVAMPISVQMFGSLLQI